MAIPNVNVTIQDGALGLAASSSARTQVKLGCSSAGPLNTLVSVSSISDLATQFGYGPLVEAAARVLAIAGGPIYVMRVTSDVAATAGAVTHPGSGTCTLTLPGAAPFDAYDLVVTIVKGGATLAAATATMTYSLDGGRTQSAEIAIPAAGTYAIPNSGISLTFTYSSGTGFVAGDTYSATCTAPGYSTTNLGTAFTALLADPRDWFLVHVVGRPADLSAARTLFAALATQMDTAAAAYRYAAALMEGPDGVTDAQILANTTGLNDLVDDRVCVGAGYVTVISPVSGRIYKRNVAWEAAAWASAIAPSADLGEVARGALSGVTSLLRDEQATPGLDAAGFITARTIIGYPGYYLTRGRVKTAAGSDFALLQNRRVIDIAASVVRTGALRFLNSKVATKRDGTIADRAAIAIEGFIKNKVDDALTRKGDAVATETTVDRTVNLLSSGVLKVRERVQPYGYPSDIEIELGFTSPSIAAAA